MSENIKHYNTEFLSDEMKHIVDDNKLCGPMFIGQGLSKRSGSDCYGYYITDKKTLGKKTIWGISRANAVMHSDWTEGTMDCSINMDEAKPTSWIVARGTIRRRGLNTGLTKWWYCDENGNRQNGAMASFGWNGAHQYQDPSF